jgi:hypothetical protein
LNEMVQRPEWSDIGWMPAALASTTASRRWPSTGSRSVLAHVPAPSGPLATIVAIMRSTAAMLAAVPSADDQVPQIPHMVGARSE